MNHLESSILLKIGGHNLACSTFLSVAKQVGSTKVGCAHGEFLKTLSLGENHLREGFKLEVLEAQRRGGG